MSARERWTIAAVLLALGILVAALVAVNDHEPRCPAATPAVAA